MVINGSTAAAADIVQTQQALLTLQGTTVTLAGTLAMGGNDITGVGKEIFGTSELTIATGVVTATKSYHSIRTEYVDIADDTADGDFNNVDDPLIVEIDAGTYPNLNGTLAVGNYIKIESEVLEVTGVAGDNITFDRPSPVAHANGEDIYVESTTDDLATINGGTVGQLLILNAAHTDKTVVIKHGTGNIKCAGGVDFSLDDAEDTWMGIHDGSNWLELSRSSNA